MALKRQTQGYRVNEHDVLKTGVLPSAKPALS
jgi:hypothetical protein